MSVVVFVARLVGMGVGVSHEILGGDPAPTGLAVVLDEHAAGQESERRGRDVEDDGVECGHRVGLRRRRGRGVVVPTSRPGFWCLRYDSPSRTSS